MHFGKDLITLNAFLSTLVLMDSGVWSKIAFSLADSVVYMLNNCTTISLCLRHNCFIPRHKIILVPPKQNFYFKVLFKAHGSFWKWLFRRDIFLSYVDIFLKFPVEIFWISEKLFLYKKDLVLFVNFQKNLQQKCGIQIFVHFCPIFWTKKRLAV